MSWRRNLFAGILLFQWLVLAPGSVLVFLRPIVPPTGGPLATAAWVGELAVKAVIVVGLPVLAVWVGDLSRFRRGNGVSEPDSEGPEHDDAS